MVDITSELAPNPIVELMETTLKVLPLYLIVEIVKI